MRLATNETHIEDRQLPSLDANLIEKVAVVNVVIIREIDVCLRKIAIHGGLLKMFQSQVSLKAPSSRGVSFNDSCRHC